MLYQAPTGAYTSGRIEAPVLGWIHWAKLKVFSGRCVVKLSLISLLAFACLAGTGYADVVTLKNGDRLTGTLVTIKGGTLELKSDILGSLTIPMASVATYTVDKPVALIIKGKEPVRGTLELAPSGDWQVKANGQTQTVAAANVETIMPAETYQSLVVAAPKPWQAWKGAISLGESIQHGNQSTNTFTTTVNAVRERPEAPIFQRHTRTNFDFITLLSHASEINSDNSVTSHTLSANLREDYLFAPSLFVFGLAQLDHISTEALYLRQTYGGGFGKDFIKNPKTTFSVIGGLTAQHQKFFSGDRDETLDGLVGEKLGEQFTKRIRFDQNLNFYPNFTHGGEYRFDTSAILSVKLFNRFAFTASAIDLYLSDAPANSQKNNVTLAVGLGYTF
jgi:putative salt-induced outer membrane protein YdiY